MACKNLAVSSDRAADDCRAGFFENLAYLLAAGNLARAGVAGIVGKHNDVAGEEGRVGPAQVQQHAVVAGNRNHPHAGHTRGGMADLWKRIPDYAPTRVSQSRTSLTVCGAELSYWRNDSLQLARTCIRLRHGSRCEELLPVLGQRIAGVLPRRGCLKDFMRSDEAASGVNGRARKKPCTSSHPSSA